MMTISSWATVHIPLVEKDMQTRLTQQSTETQTPSTEYSHGPLNTVTVHIPFVEKDMQTRLTQQSTETQTPSTEFSHGPLNTGLSHSTHALRGEGHAHTVDAAVH